MEIMKFFWECLALVTATGVCAVFKYANTLSQRQGEIQTKLAVIEAISKEKHDTIETVIKASATHEQRITIIETVITDLKSLPSLMRELVSSFAAMRTMLEQHTTRVERIEDRLYDQK